MLGSDKASAISVWKELQGLVLTSSLPFPGTASIQHSCPLTRMELLQKPTLSSGTESMMVFLPSVKSHMHSRRSRPWLTKQGEGSVSHCKHICAHLAQHPVLSPSMLNVAMFPHSIQAEGLSEEGFPSVFTSELVSRALRPGHSVD